MSAFTDAFLFFGLFSSGAGSAVDPYDVRFGVDNGDGELGTLTSPAVYDVLRGVRYGGDGVQYTGTLFAPAVPSSNRFVNAWRRLYQAQTNTLGVQIFATVEGYAVSKPAIIGSRNLNDIFIEGGMSEDGEITIQMEAGDFSGEPPKNTVVTCNGALSNKRYDLLESPENNNQIYYLKLGLMAARTKG